MVCCLKEVHKKDRSFENSLFALIIQKYKQAFAGSVLLAEILERAFRRRRQGLSGLLAVPDDLGQAFFNRKHGQRQQKNKKKCNSEYQQHAE